ncbi:MAG: hypothetical protein EBY29_14910, partial [Planctomycetes bacterium]|nr:hypothetical protein [Planctomycetota bacterium]
PEVIENEKSFDDVWECMGGKGWRLHIAALALSGSRVVVLIPPSAEGRSVVISILLGIPLERRWEIGVVEASSAEQCWAHNALIRVLAMDANDAEGDRAWPGEVVVDLRRQSIPPSVKQELFVGKQARVSQSSSILTLHPRLSKGLMISVMPLLANNQRNQFQVLEFLKFYSNEPLFGSSWAPLLVHLRVSSS